MLIHAVVILIAVTVKVRGFNDKFNNKILFLPEGVKGLCGQHYTGGTRLFRQSKM